MFSKSVHRRPRKLLDPKTRNLEPQFRSLIQYHRLEVKRNAVQPCCKVHPMKVHLRLREETLIRKDLNIHPWTLQTRNDKSLLFTLDLYWTYARVQVVVAAHFAEDTALLITGHFLIFTVLIIVNLFLPRTATR